MLVHESSYEEFTLHHIRSNYFSGDLWVHLRVAAGIIEATPTLDLATEHVTQPTKVSRVYPKFPIDAFETMHCAYSKCVLPIDRRDIVEF